MIQMVQKLLMLVLLLILMNMDPHMPYPSVWSNENEPASDILSICCMLAVMAPALQPSAACHVSRSPPPSYFPYASAYDLETVS